MSTSRVSLRTPSSPSGLVALRAVRSCSRCEKARWRDDAPCAWRRVVEADEEGQGRPLPGRGFRPGGGTRHGGCAHPWSVAAAVGGVLAGGASLGPVGGAGGRAPLSG